VRRRWLTWRMDRAAARFVYLERRLARIEAKPMPLLLEGTAMDDDPSMMAELISSGDLVVSDTPRQATFEAHPSVWTKEDQLRLVALDEADSPEADHAFWEMSAEDHLEGDWPA
jgi:hypothetical protein